MVIQTLVGKSTSYVPREPSLIPVTKDRCAKRMLKSSLSLALSLSPSICHTHLYMSPIPLGYI